MDARIVERGGRAGGVEAVRWTCCRSRERLSESEGGERKGGRRTDATSVAPRSPCLGLSRPTT